MTDPRQPHPSLPDDDEPAEAALEATGPGTQRLTDNGAAIGSAGTNRRAPGVSDLGWRCPCGKWLEAALDTCGSCGRNRTQVGASGATEASDSSTRPRARSRRTATLKEETILDQWSVVVDRGAEHADAVLDDIERRLDEAEIPGECSWALTEVKSSAFFSRVRRELLIIDLKQFGDYHMYVGVRPYGIHLDVCRFLTVEPGFLKKKLAQHTFGSADFLSAPKNILVEQDFRAWTTVVHHCVVDAITSIMKSLGQDTKNIRRESSGVLNVW